MNSPFEVLIDSFIANRIGIDKNFLPEKLVAGLTQNLIRLQADSKMSLAGIGNNLVKDPFQKIRGDKICWIENESKNEFEQEFLHLIGNFIYYLNATCYTGINDYEFHYALYEKGSFYKRHRDQFKNNSNRKFSFINYLNKDWKDEDGGQLKAYTEETEIVVIPEAQTAIFFKSEEIEHEVILANRERLSITGWLKQH